MPRFVAIIACCLGALCIVSGCDAVGENAGATGTPQPGDGPGTAFCTIATDQLYDGGVGKDGIPALSNPPLVSVRDIDFLDDADRVVGVNLNGRWIGVPHNVLWHHEIVNLGRTGRRVAVTYCPLTGSSLVFDRRTVDGAEFGVSGLLYLNNLVMYDRNQPESQWAQMTRSGSCGPRAGDPLATLPVIEMRWSSWRVLFPNSLVVSEETGHRRDYNRYPYGAYEALDNVETIFPVPSLDVRRPPKERVLGIPNSGTGGLALPFGALDAGGAVRAVHVEVDTALVVFWDRAAEAATAYRPVWNGRSLTFEVRDGEIVDRETESVWRIDGQAIRGELEGATLPAVEEAYVAFWFAWALFQPQTRLWTPRDLS